MRTGDRCRLTGRQAGRVEGGSMTSRQALDCPYSHPQSLMPDAFGFTSLLPIHPLTCPLPSAPHPSPCLLTRVRFLLSIPPPFADMPRATFFRCKSVVDEEEGGILLFTPLKWRRDGWIAKWRQVGGRAGRKAGKMCRADRCAGQAGRWRAGRCAGRCGRQGRQ